MVTALDVQRVARTAQPYTAKPGVVLDIDYVIKHTATEEWDGYLYELGATAASSVADQFNVEMGLITGVRRPKAAVTARK